PTKFTAMVPMRDGIHLAADVRLPAGDGPWPVVLCRTPYDKSTDVGAVSLSDVGRFAQNGLALVVQDTRGRHASEGKARPLFDDGSGEHQDGFDTVAWIRQQSWCNGKVATYGNSYKGVMQLLLAGSGPEGIVGQLVTAGTGSPYQHPWFQNGVWHAFAEGDGSWLEVFGWP